MAMYTSQHDIPDQVLRTKEYMAHFVQVPTPEESSLGQEGTPRWWHPFEACLLHVCYKRCFIVSDRSQAWVHVGNQISVPHALLVIINGLNLMLNASAELDLHSLFELLHKCHMQANHVHRIDFDEGILFRDCRSDDMESHPVDVRPLLCHLHPRAFSGDHVWHPGKGMIAKQSLDPAIDSKPVIADTVSRTPIANDEACAELGQALEPAQKRPRIGQELSPAAPTDVDTSESEAGEPFFDHVLFQQGSVIRGLWSDIRIKQDQFVNIWHHQILSLGHEKPPMPGREILQFGACSVLSLAPSHTQPLCLMLGGQLTLLAHPDTDTVIASLVRSTSAPVWDQFGQVQAEAVWESHVAFFDHPLSQGTLTRPVGILLPAFRAWPSQFHWCHKGDLLQLTIAGQPEQVSDIEAFWQGSMREMLASIGRQWSLTKTQAQVTIVLGPASTKVALPPDHSWLAIGVSAFRVLLDGCTVEPTDAPCITMRWNSHHLWKGHLDPACKFRDLEECLCYVLRPVIGPSNVQVFIGGRSWSLMDTIGEATRSLAEPCIVHIRCDWSGHFSGIPDPPPETSIRQEPAPGSLHPTVSCTATWPASTGPDLEAGVFESATCPVSAHPPCQPRDAVLSHSQGQGAPEVFPLCVIPANHTQLPDIFPRPLFLPRQCQIGQLIAKIRSVLLQQGVHYSGPVYIVFDGRVLKHATKISELVATNYDWNFPRTLTITAEDLFGVGFKHTHKTKVSNALAGTLLEGGFAIQWVSKTMEMLNTKVDHKDLTAVAGISAGPKRLTAIIELCHSRQIEVPAPGTKDHHPNQSSKHSKQRKLQAPPDPSQYRIASGYFLNEDNTECEQIATFKSGTTGVYLCSSQEAMQWLQSAGRLSSDELALLILGELPLGTKLDPSLTCSLSVPCEDPQGRSVILACNLVQFGAKKVTIIKSSKTVAMEASKTVAFAMYKEDWKPEAWSELLHNTFQVARAQMKDDVILSCWGRSFRAENKAVQPHQAHSVQIHCLIKASSLSAVLAGSGFNHLFATPKDEQGRPDTGYRILWLTADGAYAKTLAARLNNHLGLVKGKKTLGLKFTVDAFEEAWKVANPTAPVPSAVSSNFVYKLDALPYGVTNEALVKWADSYSWKLRPFKALGPRAWLVGAETHAPDGILTFNGSPVLVRLVPPKNSTAYSPIVAGPRPTNASSQTANIGAVDGLQLNDPWARWHPSNPGGSNAPAGQSLSRQPQGPMETRFVDHEQRSPIWNRLCKGWQKITRSRPQLHHSSCR